MMVPPQTFHAHHHDGSRASTGNLAMRRPRDRPPGSRNRPRPVVGIIQESPPAMHTVVLEFTPGSDILEGVKSFVEKRQVGLTILSGSGTIAGVTLRDSARQYLTLWGRYEIASLTGTLFPSGTEFSVSLQVEEQGNVRGGTVDGQLIALGTVKLIVTCFSSWEYCKMSDEIWGLEEHAGL